MAALQLSLFFEWGGGCLWPANDAAREAIPDRPADDSLPLADAIRADLARLSAHHDSALDWSDPAGPSPWTAEDFRRFDARARALRDRIATCLGSGYEITYDIADRDEAMLDATTDRRQSGEC